MPAPDLCGELMAWSRQYPVPSAPAERNEAARIGEDKFLARFAGLAALDRDQAAELVGWKFQGMAHRKALALRGISPGRWDDHDGSPGAAALIRTALASNDDYQALATMADGGIHRFGPAMSSVILAACQPQRFTMADSRALKTLRGLGLMPPGPPQFRLDDWLPYLTACRTLAHTCGLSLRQVDRALWVGTLTQRIPRSAANEVVYAHGYDGCLCKLANPNDGSKLAFVGPPRLPRGHEDDR